ncbi:MAG: oligosaccharide flippase family protein, partial [Lysobacter sp.]|nr:oligosaccharide flippase family protein [Lysobacter sp.]
MRLAASRFARDSFLLTGVTAVERVAALLQTILIARALGIVEYGIYGLLFTSIGFVASIAGLQMGLTATVLVARYRDTEKAKAAAVIGNVTRFALLVALAFWVLSLP